MAGTIEARTPLSANVTFNEDDVPYEAEIETLSISTFAETREELELALQDEIAAAWSIYTPESDERLTENAQRLKERLRETFREVTNVA